MFPVGSSNPKYIEEKNNGRRMPNGALKLTRLKPKHELILSLHLHGLTQQAIAERMHISPQRLSAIMNDPLFRSHARERIERMDEDLVGLKAKAIAAISDGLDFDQDIGTRLAAADKWFKTQGYFDKNKPHENATAEDVVARLLQAVQVNVNVNGEHVSVETNTKSETINE